MTLRTHYDNLHISPDADDTAIRLAYRRLSKQYHPDLNHDPDAHRIMQLINQAYEVLSHPTLRAEHDRWIAQQKALHKPHAAVHTVSGVPERPASVLNPSTADHAPKNRAVFWAMMTAVLCAVALLGWQIWYVAEQKMIASATVAAPQQLSADNSDMHTEPPASVSQSNGTAHNHPLSGSLMAQTGYIRPDTAPNGHPWPDESGYIAGYDVQSGQGHYRLYIDNVRNTSDVYAELMREGETQPLRRFFIKERGYLILDKLDAGIYAVRYRQLDSGETLLSEHIQMRGNASESTIYLQRGKAPVL